jgi:DNA segregation ATPase FtsK/SpoIIIE, S-DNA-T family
MRRVVTGEEIAQLRNPDPFAVPAWRSPVYRTPLAIVAIVHAIRLLYRLVRLLARHPVLVLAVIVSVLMWRIIGWPGLTVLAVSIAAVLVVWRWRFPVSFSRFIGTPARGQWRAWHYRRRWAAVMTIGRLAPMYQGRVLLPVLGKVSATRFTDRVQVRLVSGQSAADFAARADNLAHGFGAMLCRIRSASPGALVLEFVRRDALAAVIPRSGDRGPGGSAGACGGPPRGRPALAGPRARHPHADRRGHRGGEGLAAVVDRAFHAPGDGCWAGPCLGG